MIAVYVCSDDARAGKTAFALGLARRLLREGRSVGYWKPRLPASSVDDAGFARALLSLDADVAALAPALLSDDPDQATYSTGLAAALRAAAADKAVLVVEGDGALASDGAVRPSARGLLDLLGEAKVLYLARYRDGREADRILAAAAAVGEGQFAGAIINAVPVAQQWYVAERQLPQLHERGVPVYGVAPQNAALATMTVRELVAALDGKVLVNGNEPGLDGLFESIMFGSMSAEDGQRYFSAKQHKLVITRGDRPDVHLAALDTSTRCLLLTGGYPSYPFVLDKAEGFGVPVVSVAGDMQATIDRVDALLAETRARSVAKIRLFEDLMTKAIDTSALGAALGLE